MKKRLGSALVALALCLGLTAAGSPAVRAADYPELSYQEARDTYGFTVDMGDLDLGQLTPLSEVEDRFLTVTNNSNADMYVDLISYGGFSILGDTSHVLSPGSSHDYRLLGLGYYSIAKDGPNRVPVSFHVCANYEVHWDYIGSAAFGSQVGGFDFQVDAAWVSYDKVNKDDFQAQDWISLSGLTGGTLELGAVRQELVQDQIFEGIADFTVTNLLSEPLNITLQERLSDQAHNLSLEPEKRNWDLAPGESRTVAIPWRYYFVASGSFPDGLGDSCLTLTLSGHGTSKSVQIPLSMAFKASEAYPLSVTCFGDGTVTNDSGNVLSGKHTIPGSGLTVRFVPGPGSYLKALYINGKVVGPRDAYRFERVTEAQSINAVFDTLESKPMATYPIVGYFCSTAPSFGTATVNDPEEGPRTVRLYPAGTLIGVSAGVGWGYIRDLQTQQDCRNAGITDNSYFLSYMDILNDNIPVRFQDGTHLAEFPADRPFVVGSSSTEAVMIVSSHAAPRNEPAAWARADVDAAVKAGLVPYELQSAYNQAATRAEFCALATRIYEEVTQSSPQYQTGQFVDTLDPNVLKMATLGVVNGVGEGRFAPDQPLTREQAATMLVRLAEALSRPLPAAESSFADQAQISSWALDAVGRMQTSGIMGGVGQNTFSPKGSYTREQSIITALRTFRQMS